ncbi:MAG TPA: NmrA family NAD(P)-binding protein [Microlunatus sp.]
MIVVTGGTGTIGGALIRRLRSEGRGDEVLALVRKPIDLGVRTELGDFNDPSSIVKSLSPGDRLFLNAMPFPRFVETFSEVIDLAKAASVAQIVEVSVRSARPGNKLSSGVHGEVDEHLRASGVPYAILQPTSFMQNLARDLRDDRLTGSYGAAAMNYVDGRDIGDVAATLLTAPVGASADYVITGPESLSHDQIAARMSAALGREIRYLDLPVAELAAQLAAAGVPEPYATDLPAEQATLGESWAEVLPTVEQVTGRPPRTLEQFLADHRTNR